MPDAHTGFGMPIGGILATKDVVVPNAVGVDIGCGVSFALLGVEAEHVKRKPTKENLLLLLAQEILQAIPTGFKHHKTKQSSRVLTYYEKQIRGSKGLPSLEEGYYQVGTLGGGNHFIELQEDTKGRLGLMVHSGSRNFGYKIAHHFNAEAKKSRAGSYEVPKEYDLAYLLLDHPLGQDYLLWQNLALDFARENREQILKKAFSRVVSVFQKHLTVRLELGDTLDIHHNYVAKETYQGEELFIHRKGAVSAKKGEQVLIPGAMGSFSYLGLGLGNPHSFSSCSHGAGRKMGRKEALKTYSTASVWSFLKQEQVILATDRPDQIPEEHALAYKDIDAVMENQKELVLPLEKMKTLVVIKG